MSPKSSKLSAVMVEDGQEYLYLFDLDPDRDPLLKPVRLMSKSEHLYFQDYKWVNEDVLLADIRTTVRWYGNLLNVTRFILIPADKALDHKFISADSDSWGRPKQHSNFIHRLPKDNDHILVAVDEDEKAQYLAPEVDRVNVYTGKKQRVQRNIKGIYDWIADNDGNIRVGVAYKGLTGDTDQLIYYRDKGENFKVFQRANYFDNKRYVPVAFHERDNNILLVRSTSEDEKSSDDKSRLYQFDLNKSKLIGPYINSKHEEVISKFEKALPGYTVSIVSSNDDDSQFIVYLHSDTKVPAYFYYNERTGLYTRFPSPYPELEGKLFSKMEELSYSARDGLTIPAFLTMPHSSRGKKVPTIVFPHGGPWSHDVWGFDPYVQFFADRGYAVFQPQFRGSTGYGADHEQAGYQQWGLAIQDDITDGVRWLIEQGIADPDKICIVGESFGGYAAAMGLAKTPELYRCGVSVAGVLDMKQFIADRGEYMFSGINKAILNKKKEAKLVSPYHLADQIRAPLLLIHGDKDTVVPIKHSKKLYKKLKRNKNDVELIKIKGGEHWHTSEQHQLQKLQAIDTFLAKHLK